MITYGSVCSGIEAATVAWEPLGFKPKWFSEIDPFACSVLSHRFPGTPNLGDFTKIGSEHGPVDLIVGGTPCQDFSVAGLRKGFAGDRGRLTVEFVRLLERLVPRWFVWENVPGVMSADGGRAFGAFLGELGKCGYGFAYRILDSRYFGCACPRPRVFVVGNLGDWRRPAAVLLEHHCLKGNSGQGREGNEERGVPVLTRRGHATFDGKTPCVAEEFGVRKATPLEWERAMGFPDNWTDVPGATPRRRWSAVGNSMAVPVMQWIGERILMVEDHR